MSAYSNPKQVAKIFLINKVSVTCIIPIETARKYGLNDSSHVVVEETDDGILIRKLNLWLINKAMELTSIKNHASMVSCVEIILNDQSGNCLLLTLSGYLYAPIEVGDA